MRLDEKQRILLVKLYRLGTSAQKIADIIGCGKVTIYRNLDKMGIIKRTKLKINGKTHTKFDIEEEKLICEFYNEGISSKEICKEFDCDAATIRNIVRRHGYEIKNRGCSFRTFTQLEINKVLELWDSGYPITGVVYKTKLHYNQIIRILSNNNRKYKKRFTDKKKRKIWTENNRRYQYYGPSWYLQKEKVKIRDNYSCQICKIDSYSARIEIAHIKNFNTFGLKNHEKANKLENLICLCKSCHGIYDRRKREERKEVKVSPYCYIMYLPTTLCDRFIKCNKYGSHDIYSVEI